MQAFFEPRRWAPFLEPAIWQFIWTGLQITLSMAAIAIIGSLALGLFLALCRMSRLPFLRYPAVVFVETVRALPVLLLIFFIFFGAARAGLGLSPFGAGTLALTLYTGAINAEIMRAGITSIGRGQWEAARSLGLDYRQTLSYIVFPQAARRVVPPGKPDHHTDQGHVPGRRDRGGGADPPGAADLSERGQSAPVIVRLRLHLLLD